jgi:CheY-like chemotaxis protein
MRVECAADGALALQALYLARETGDPFRVALIDMQMPGMNGVSLARAIRVDDTLLETRMVLFTSLGERGDAKRMKDLGFDGYLTKPARHTDIVGCLSAVLAPSDRNLAPAPLVTRHTVREMRRGTVRILLAEDNVTNQDVAIGLLMKFGLRADAVANGKEAITALESIPYDLVLMDVQMPEMDGLEATRHIRDPHSAVLNHQVPVIAMTANAMQGDREQCLAAGMNDYVSKPIAPRALDEALTRWLPQTAAPAADKTDAAREEIRPDAAESEVPVFDLAAVMDRMMDDEELARKVIAGYLKDVPSQTLALRTYLNAGDQTGATRQVHSLKSASASVGGEAVRRLALEMEAAARAGDLGSVTAGVPALELEIARLTEALQAFLDRPSRVG